jgi:hypothetical protein
MLHGAIQGAWSVDTSADPAGWSEDNPAWGQCAVTALVVQDLLGGELLRAEVNCPRGKFSHYWNRVDGGEIDLTHGQFGSGFWYFSDGVIVREREYVLSFAPTLERYLLLKASVLGDC